MWWNTHPCLSSFSSSPPPSSTPTFCDNTPHHIAVLHDQQRSTPQWVYNSEYHVSPQRSLWAQPHHVVWVFLLLNFAPPNTHNVNMVHTMHIILHPTIFYDRPMPWILWLPLLLTQKCSSHHKILTPFLSSPSHFHPLPLDIGMFSPSKNAIPIDPDSSPHLQAASLGICSFDCHINIFVQEARFHNQFAPQTLHKNHHHHHRHPNSSNHDTHVCIVVRWITNVVHD